MRTYLLEIGLGAVLACVVGVYGVFFVGHPAEWSDFRAFRSAVIQWQTEPDSLYDLEVQHAYQLEMMPEEYRDYMVQLPYVNPPSFLVFYFWTTGVEPQVGYWIWGGLMTILYVGILYGLWTLFPVKYAVLLGLASLSFSPFYGTLFLSQSSVITLGLFVLIYWCLRDEHWLGAGLATGLLAYKPQLAILLGLYYVLTVRNWRLYAGLLAGGLVHVGISWWMVPGFVDDMLRTLGFSYTLNGMGPELRVTWMGLVYQFLRWTGWDWWPVVGLLLSLLTMGLTLLVAREYKVGDKRWPETFGLIVVATLVSCLHAHYHDVLILVLVAWLMVWRYGYTRWLLVGMVSGWLIYLGANFTPFYPNPLPILPTAYLVVVWGWFVWRLGLKNQGEEGNQGDR